jgi:hypothetical protein
MAAINVGSVEVDVLPNTQRFSEEMRAGVLPQASTLGEEIGKLISDRIAASIQAGLRSGLNGGDPAAAGGRAGEDYGGTFARVVKTRIEAALRSLPDVQIGVATSEAEQKLVDLHAALETLKGQRIGVDISDADAKAELARIKASLDELSRKSPDVSVRVNAGAAAAELAALNAELDRLDGRHVDPKVSGGAESGISGLLVGIAALGPALIPVGAAAVAGIGAIGAAAVSGAAGLGVLYLGLSGVVKAITAVNAEQEQSGPAALAAAAAQQSAAAAVQGAQTGLSNAIRTADNAAISSAQSVANARTGVADAVRSAGASITNALQAQDNAEQSLAGAQQQEKTAQDALTLARKTAAQQLEDLTLQVEDGALSQRAATLAVVAAKAALDQSNAAGSTALARAQAQLGYDTAVQHVKDLGVQQDRLREQKAAADKAGVDGSAQVVTAQNGVTTATRAVGTAQGNVAKTTAAVAEAQRAGAESVGKAQEAVSNALRAQGQQAESSAAAIASAQLALANAQRAATTAAESTNSAAQAANEALAKLTPTGREFVTFIQTSFMPALHGLKASAEDGLLPGLQDGLKGMMPLIPALDGLIWKLSSTMGGLFRSAGQALGSPFWQNFVTFLSTEGSKTIDMFGWTIGNLVTGFAGLMQAFAPLTDAIGKGFLNMSKNFADFATDTDPNSGFQSFVRYLQQALPLVVQTLGDLSRAFGTLIEGLAPFGLVALPIIDMLSQLATALGPTGLVDALAVASSAFVAFKLVTGTLTFNPVLLAITAVVAAFAQLWNVHNQSNAAIEESAKAYTTAFVSTHGAITQEIRDKVALDAVNQKLIQDAQQYGSSAKNTVDAIIGQGDAYEKLRAQLQAVVDANKRNPLTDSTPFSRVLVDLGLQTQAEATLNDTGQAAQGVLDKLNALHLAVKTGQADSQTYASAQDALTKQQKDVADATGKVNDELQKSISKFTILRQGTLDAVTAADSLASAYDALAKSFRDNGNSMDGNTAAGRSNHKAINDVATALNDQVTGAYRAKAATGDLTGALADATRTTEENRKRLIDQMVQMGVNRQVATDYANGLLLNPAELFTIANPPDLTAARTTLANYQSALDQNPLVVKMWIDTTGMQLLTNLRAGLGLDQPTPGMPSGLQVPDGLGGGSYNADGNIYRAFASGGLESHVAQISAGMGKGRIWAEDETGGESYIPLAPSKRSRSLDIWRETGQLLGALPDNSSWLQPGDVGAGMASASMPSHSSVTSTSNVNSSRGPVSIRIDAPQQANPQHLAAEIAWSMR